MMKKSNKYNYLEGKQITDPDTGKRVYEISSYRLPSVTTILGATKNTTSHSTLCRTKIKCYEW